MNRADIMKRARTLTRDLKNTIFREEDVIDFINEGIDRVTMLITECENMVWLDNNTDVPILLPKPYHHLLAVYCSSRLFTQDDNDTKAVMLMNEFESKIDELKNKIDSGEVVIVDAYGDIVDSTKPIDYVVDNYYNTSTSILDSDVSVSDDVELDGGDFTNEPTIIYDGGTF